MHGRPGLGLGKAVLARIVTGRCAVSCGEDRVARLIYYSGNTPGRAVPGVQWRGSAAAASELSGGLDNTLGHRTPVHDPLDHI